MFCTLSPRGNASSTRAVSWVRLGKHHLQVPSTQFFCRDINPSSTMLSLTLKPHAKTMTPNGCMRSSKYLSFCCMRKRCRSRQVQIWYRSQCCMTHEHTLSPEFHRYVRPTEQPTLTEFCTTLTGITQGAVDAAQPLDGALADLQAWMESRGLMEHHRVAFCTGAHVILPTATPISHLDTQTAPGTLRSFFVRSVRARA